MICLSFVQGRLSKKIGSKLQYFPINNWQNEISIAQKIGFKYIEWIVSDYSNPIFNQIFQKQICFGYYIILLIFYIFFEKADEQAQFHLVVDLEIFFQKLLI